MSFCTRSIIEQKSKAFIKFTSNGLQMNNLRKHTKQTLKINDRVAKLSYGETISIYSSEGSIKAEILFEQQVVEGDIDVILVGKVLNLEKTGNLNGIGMGIVFSKEKRILYIGEVKGLKGGSIKFTDYEDYNKLVESIKDVGISQVSYDLKILLSTMTLINSKIRYQQNINLPQDISETLTELVNILNTNCSIRNNDLNTLKNNLAKIIPEKCYWEFLEMFLEFYFIRRLPAFASRKIIKGFTQDYKVEDILKLFTKYQITDDTLNSEIESRQSMFYEKYSSLIDDEDDITEWDLMTWINQILKQKDKINNSLFQLLDKDDKFFKGKFLNYRDPNTQRTIIADYIEDFAKNAQEITIKFSGFHSMLIKFSENQIQIESNLYKEKGLSNYFFRTAQLSANNKIQNSNKVIISDSSQSIHSGEYTLKRLKDRVKRQVKFIFLIVNEYIIQTFTLENTENLYKIKIYLSKISIKPMRIKIIKNNVSVEEYISYEDMDKFIRVSIFDIKKICEPLSVLMPHIIIDFYEDANRRKIQQLALIKGKLERLRIRLINSKEKRIQILEEYINRNLTEITPEFVARLEDKSFSIRSVLLNLTAKYYEELFIIKTPEEILLRLALQAQYEALVNKKSSFDVQQTMELISESKKYADQIRGKQIVIILGSTGSGKSTASCYLMKAEMRTYITQLGDDAIEIANRNCVDEYPKICHSIGKSDNLYARGYKLSVCLKNKTPIQLMLCDCPGFRDTRGIEYELCKNLSIDRAIKSAGCIKGIIFVIQYNAFLQDGGQPVLESFQNLIDIIPGLLEEESLLDSVFILITKVSDKININTITERIRTHINEIELLIEYQSSNYDASDALQYKYQMWSKIQQINATGHLFIVNFGDFRQRKKILNAIYKSQNIHISKFSSAIVSKELYKNYADFIEIETHSWIKIVFPNFLKHLPEKITEKIQELEKNLILIDSNSNKIKSKRIEELNKGHNKDIINLEKEINNLNEKNKILNEEIVQLKKERKFMALSIYDNLKVLENLCEFCSSLNYGTLGQVRNESLESAREYIAYYTENISIIKREIFQELY
ncbi:hypothetical protein SteCoe_29610 [Stentor coeruleus]|uniref:G domain-containing protein n=1 Tax=Stentor coeruleus TaxID=5963 RepID=A0A1R2B5K4_9CILI|nr:hypothetical protein SteCoe_29610 [Stentor coeruleus]